MAIPLTMLNNLPEHEFVALLGGVFEHSPWVAESVAGARPFSSIGVMHDAMVASVRSASTEMQDQLIKAHPDLAGKAARAGTLTDSSTREQSGAGLDRMTGEQFARFDKLNNDYQNRFGFPFIIAVRGHSVDSILRAFEQRLSNSQDVERQTALEQIARIARFRLNDIIDEQTTPDGQPINGEAIWDG